MANKVLLITGLSSTLCTTIETKTLVDSTVLALRQIFAKSPALQQEENRAIGASSNILIKQFASSSATLGTPHALHLCARLTVVLGSPLEQSSEHQKRH